MFVLAIGKGYPEYRYKNVIKVKSERETNIVYKNIYVESRKMIQMNLFAKQKHRHKHREQMYGYQEGGGWDELGNRD